MQRIGNNLDNEQKRFNLLSVFDDLINENAWSRLFAYLFNSKKEHGLKQTALRKWLQLIANSINTVEIFLKQLPSENESEIVTITEWYTETGRRLDILIKFQDQKTGITKAIIGIENKVDSDEQSEQISDYQKSLIKHFAKKPTLIFLLTPDGRQPHTSNFNKDCPCISYSYNSIIQVCDYLKPNANEQLLTFLSVLENHIRKLIKLNKMESSIRETIHKLYENPKYNNAIKLISQYAPNIRYVFEGLREHFKKSPKELDIPLKKYNDAQSGPYITKVACEFQLYFDDFDNLYGEDYSPRYILHFNGTNPNVGDELYIRLMLYYEPPKRGDRKSKQKLRNEILEIAQLPNSMSDKKHWEIWINIWASESYILKDLGNKDIEGLSKLLCKSIRQTYIPLKAALKKLSKY